MRRRFFLSSAAALGATALNELSQHLYALMKI